MSCILKWWVGPGIVASLIVNAPYHFGWVSEGPSDRPVLYVVILSIAVAIIRELTHAFNEAVVKGEAMTPFNPVLTTITLSQWMRAATAYMTLRRALREIADDQIEDHDTAETIAQRALAETPPAI